MDQGMYKELAKSIAFRDGQWSFMGTVSEVQSTVALRGFNALDELSSFDLRCLAGFGVEAVEAERLARTLGVSLSDVRQSIDRLLDYGFLVMSDYVLDEVLCTGGAIFEPTQIGKEVIWQIAVEALQFDRFKMKQGVVRIDDLLERIEKLRDRA